MGTGSVVLSAFGTASGSVQIDFGNAYSSIPRVFLTDYGASTGLMWKVGMAIGSVTTTGATMIYSNTSGGAVNGLLTFAWMAVA